MAPYPQAAWRRRHEPRQDLRRRPPLFARSINLLLAHEDKIYPGAMIASLRFPGARTRATTNWAAITWCGRATWCRRPPRCWPRASGNAAARLIYLAIAQREDGGFARTSGSTARPYWTGVQLDEVRFRSSWHGGCGRPTRWASSILTRSLSAPAAYSDPRRAGDRRGALGRRRRLFAFDAGQQHRSTDLRGGDDRSARRSEHRPTSVRTTLISSSRTSKNGR